METKDLLNIGYGNFTVRNRIIAIVAPDSSPVKRAVNEAKESSRLIDATHGRKTRSVIITDSNHYILSAVQPETVANRFT